MLLVWLCTVVAYVVGVAVYSLAAYVVGVAVYSSGLCCWFGCAVQ